MSTTDLLSLPPQELAALILSAHPRFDQDILVDAAALQKKADDFRQAIEDMHPYNLDDTKLAAELPKFINRAIKDDVWDPATGPKAAERLALTRQHTEQSFPDDPDYAAELASSQLAEQGYASALQFQRRYLDYSVTDQLDKFIDTHYILPKAEAENIAELHRCTFDLHNLDDAARMVLQRDFPDGNFLYHGADTVFILRILQTGKITTVKALDNYSKVRERAGHFDENLTYLKSGFEAISWSMNAIDALPGDRYHLAGFLTSPELLLERGGDQLAIPNRPAPYEVVQLPARFNADGYYRSKTFLEMYEDFGFMGTANSVFANLLEVDSWLNNYDRQSIGYNPVFKTQHMAEPLLLKARRKYIEDSNYRNRLKQLYSLGHNSDTIILSPLLYNQSGPEPIPVAIVWLQALVDTGRIAAVPGLAVETVPQIIEGLDPTIIKALLDVMKHDTALAHDIVGTALKYWRDVTVPVPKLYIVIPRQDAELWLKVLARVERRPLGVLLYDERLVRLENFNSAHRGDHGKLSGILRRALPRGPGYIDYDQVLGTEFSDEMRAGQRRQLVGEQYLQRSRSMYMDDTGLKPEGADR